MSWLGRPHGKRRPAQHDRTPVHAFAALLACLLVAGLGAAMAAPPEERERLAAERRSVDARHAEARAACQTQFLVNDCLEAARTQHRLSLDILRQQQLRLDDARRRERAAERAQLQVRSAAASAPATAPVLRQPRQAAADAGAASSTGPSGRPEALPVPAAAASGGASTVAASALQHQQAFDRRQQAAQAHQRAVEARNARHDATRPPAASLPLPVVSLPLPAASAASATTR
jgi:colicin import membrane protein